MPMTDRITEENENIIEKGGFKLLIIKKPSGTQQGKGLLVFEDKKNYRIFCNFFRKLREYKIKIGLIGFKLREGKNVLMVCQNCVDETEVSGIEIFLAETSANEFTQDSDLITQVNNLTPKEFLSFVRIILDKENNPVVMLDIKNKTDENSTDK